MKWLFLVHQVHSRQSRERVKVWRTLKKIGAVLYRNSVYVLPYSKERLEDFQWASQQINDAKGEASVFVSESGDARENQILRTLFKKARSEEYDLLLGAASRLNDRIFSTKKQKRLNEDALKDFEKEVRGMQEGFREIRKIDFFDDLTPKRFLAAVQQIQNQLTGGSTTEAADLRLPSLSTKEFQGRKWGTREKIHIDRICSAWLIRKFIDPRATFVFAPESQLPADAILFDVYGAQFSHHGEDCTFETLTKIFGIVDPAVLILAEIIHDVDLKDRKFNRPEAAGLDVTIRALSHTIPDDSRLLAAGSALLDALYAFYSDANTNAAVKIRRPGAKRASSTRH